MIINDLNNDNKVELLLEFLPNIEMDAFGYNGIAEDIATNVLRAAKPPFVYAICGTWGSGKSTLLKLLLNYLPSPQEKVIVVYFNAWRASIHSNILAVLVQEIMDQINETNIIKKSWFYRNKLKITGESLVKSVIESFSELTLATKLFYKFIGKLKKKDILNEFKRNLNAQKQVRNKFEEISNILTERGFTAFVFIDELDRCSPDKVIQIIETIRMVFSHHDELYYAIRARNKAEKYNVNSLQRIPFKYILTLDENYVAKAFSSCYNLTIEEAHRYLSKFIQLKYHFPNREWGKFVKSVLYSITPMDLRDTFLPNDSIEDFSNYLMKFSIEAPRDAHRILAYLTLWQNRFLVRGVNTSIMKIIDEISGDNSIIRERFISAVNGVFFLFAIIKVKYPSQVSEILKANLVQKLCKNLLEKNTTSDHFIQNLRVEKINIDLINSIKEHINFLKEKLCCINKEKTSEYFEKIVIEIVNS